MNDLIRTARVTGAWYLGLAVTGMLGFLLVRPELLVAGDPAATLANLRARPGLARLGIVLELGIVLTQALAALWFYKLLSGINRVAAVGVAAYGLVNAAAILVSAACLAATIAVAADSSLAPAGDAAATVGLLYKLSGSAWGVGAVFFGLWLIPMGWVAATSGRFPRPLGWILIAGGVGYILSALVGHGWAAAPRALVSALSMPATVGEFWMIGYLLVRGIGGGRD
jgi:hypothetical protein